MIAGVTRACYNPELQDTNTTEPAASTFTALPVQERGLTEESK